MQKRSYFIVGCVFVALSLLIILQSTVSSILLSPSENDAGFFENSSFIIFLVTAGAGVACIAVSYRKDDQLEREIEDLGKRLKK